MKKISCVYPIKLKEAVLSIRDSGKTNMFDIPRVFELMLDFGYYNEADWIMANRNEYLNFIFTDNTKSLEET